MEDEVEEVFAWHCALAVDGGIETALVVDARALEWGGEGREERYQSHFVDQRQLPKSSPVEGKHNKHHYPRHPPLTVSIALS